MADETLGSIARQLADIQTPLSRIRSLAYAMDRIVHDAPSAVDPNVREVLDRLLDLAQLAEGLADEAADALADAEIAATRLKREAA